MPDSEVTSDTKLLFFLNNAPTCPHAIRRIFAPFVSVVYIEVAIHLEALCGHETELDRPDTSKFQLFTADNGMARMVLLTDS